MSETVRHINLVLRQYLVRLNIRVVVDTLISDPELLEGWQRFSDELKLPVSHKLRASYSNSNSYNLFSDIIRSWISRNSMRNTSVYDLARILICLEYVAAAESLQSNEGQYIRTNESDNVNNHNVNLDDSLPMMKVLGDLNYIHAHINLIIRCEFLTQFYTLFRSSAINSPGDEWTRHVVLFCTEISPEYTEVEQESHRQELRCGFEGEIFIKRMLDTSVECFVKTNGTELDENDIDHFWTFSKHAYPSYANVIKMIDISTLKALCKTRITKIREQNPGLLVRFVRGIRIY